MTDTNNKDLKIKELIENAKNIAIMPSKVANVDAFAAAVGLYYSLKASEKHVSLIYQGKKPVECAEIIPDDEITGDVSQRELVVSLDYSNTNASKVHYYPDSDHDILYITVSPVTKDFDLSRIKAEIKGFNFDLIITIGAQSLEDYGQFFKELEEEFVKSTIINIDNTGFNLKYGTVNVIDTMQSSLSLMTLTNAIEWKYLPDSKAAKAFLTGITHRK